MLLRAILLFVCLSEALAQRPRLSRKPPAADEFDDAKSVNVTGVVRQVEPKSVMIDASDHRFLTFKIERATKMPSGALGVGDFVRIQGTQDKEAFLTAKEITKETPPPAVTKVAEPGIDPPKQAAAPEPKVAAPVPVSNKPAAPDPEDGGPPRLRRNQPNPTVVDTAVVASSSSDSGKTLAEVVAAPVEDVTEKPAIPAESAGKSASSVLIERAREWALSFTESLPNYVCQQFTTRYLKLPGQSGWQAKDVVRANVVFENGKEDYRNIAINGRVQTKRMEDLPGSWSTGEFGTTLRSLFHPGRRAVFRFLKQSQIIGMTASVFDYSVKREYSDWRVQLGGQSIIPAYSGRVWIDQKTARVIRIEMQADDIPVEFPLDKVESSNEYGLVRLATTDQFMLPIHAEMLSCERGSTFCSRNAIEFRNYRKFSGEAEITY